MAPLKAAVFKQLQSLPTEEILHLRDNLRRRQVVHGSDFRVGSFYSGSEVMTEVFDVISAPSTRK